MKRISGWASLTGLVATVGMALLLIIAGCSNDSDEFIPPPSGQPTSTPTPPLEGSCAPSSSIAALIQGMDVIAYVPKGNWASSATGVSMVQVEGTGVASTVIPTDNAANSCASNSMTGQTVCVANNTDVYLINGSTIAPPLTSGGSGTIGFSGGGCTNCGVSMDPINNRALIGLAVASAPGYQILDLGGTPTFQPPFASAAGDISENLVLDPVHNLILSAAENNTYELVENFTTATPAFFENAVTGLGEGIFDSAGEDCQTGIALATIEFTSTLFLADLTQAMFTAGSPGTWTAPSQVQDFPDFVGMSAGTSGIAVAQNTHLGVVTGEFGGSLFGAIQLPSTSGTGIPAVVDWVACDMPDDPTPQAWSEGNDPHTVTAYQSPNNGDAMAILANGAGSPPTYLALVDLTKMLDTAIVPRNPATHTCADGTNLETAGVVTFFAVP
jgi:hypothetical protein